VTNIKNKFIKIALLSLIAVAVVIALLNILSPKKVIAQNQHAAGVHLNRYVHFTELMRDASIEGELLSYKSAYDHSEQPLFILKPAGEPAKRLFFFFHGMDGDRGDVVVVRELVRALDARVICVGGGPSWVSDAFIANAQQIIDAYSSNSEGFYLIGISMGGTQVLALAGILPEELRNRISGVIALIPGSDLPAIMTKSSNQSVRKTLKASVNGDKDKLKGRSPINLIHKYKKGLPFVIFYNTSDSILLHDKIKYFISELNKTHPVSIFTAPGEHDFTYTDVNYEKIFYELGKNSLRKRPIPRLMQ
jgi:dienelactone hydrolase